MSNKPLANIRPRAGVNAFTCECGGLAVVVLNLEAYYHILVNGGGASAAVCKDCGQNIPIGWKGGHFPDVDEDREIELLQALV